MKPSAPAIAAALFAVASPALAEQVNLDLMLAPATSEQNTLDLSVSVDLGIASDSDSDTSTVSGNALADVDIDFASDGTVDAINSISFAGGTVQFDDDLTFNLSFLFGAATVNASGTNLAGQLQTPGAPASVDANGDFGLDSQSINVNQGVLTAQGTGLASAIDTTIDFAQEPLAAALLGTANLDVMLDSVVGTTATYTATLTAPISFSEPFDASGIEVFVSADGNILATDTFTRELTFEETGDIDGDGFVGAADLDILLANWGSLTLPGQSGDLNGNSRIDQGDLDIVQANFGNGTPPSVVPEPGSLLVLGLGGLALVTRRRRG
ncbi:PEP-CTERM sorting domain-containing protein [Phycisphaeraceae bacterium D3-23]